MFDRFYKFFAGIAVLFASGFLIQCIVLSGTLSPDLSLNGREIKFPTEQKICQKQVCWEKVNGLWGRKINETVMPEEKLLVQESINPNSLEIKILGWAQKGEITDIFISITGKILAVKPGDYVEEHSLKIKDFSCYHAEGTGGLAVIPILKCYDEISKKEFIVKANK